MSRTPGPRKLHQDCARVERECLSLHAALAEAIRRIQRSNGHLDRERQQQVTDLMTVLDNPDAPVIFR